MFVKPLTHLRPAFIAGLCLLTGCASTAPVAYEGLSSARQLTPNSQDRGGRVPLLYSQQNVDFRAYTAVIVDPVTIYRGRDNQFGTMSEADKTALAQYMKSAFENRLKTRFSVAPGANSSTLRVKLTLTGARVNTPVLSTLTKITPAGLAVNGVQAARGREGALSGSVNYSVEVYDSATSKLLLAYVSKQYPSAMNIGSSLTSLGASRIGIDKGADDLATRLQGPTRTRPRRV